MHVFSFLIWEVLVNEKYRLILETILFILKNWNCMIWPHQRKATVADSFPIENAKERGSEDSATLFGISKAISPSFEESGLIPVSLNSRL